MTFTYRTIRRIVFYKKKPTTIQEYEENKFNITGLNVRTIISGIPVVCILVVYTHAIVSHMIVIDSSSNMLLTNWTLFSLISTSK